MDDSPSIPETHESRSDGYGPIVAIVIIVLLIIAGGMYFFLHVRDSASSGTPAVGAVRV